MADGNGEARKLLSKVDGFDAARLSVAVAGAGTLSYGCWLHYAPLGFIVGGALLLLIAILGALRAG